MAELTSLIGQRVRLAPNSHLYTRGDRYAIVDGVTRTRNLILTLESGHRATVHPDCVQIARDSQLRVAVATALEACDTCCLDNAPERERILETIMANLAELGIRS